jgi:galactokinase
MKHNKVKEAFKKEFVGEYRFFAAPGRINLIGEHTDYNDGYVLPAAIDKKIYLAIAPVKGSTVKIKSLDFNEMVEFDIHEADAKLPHWAKYPYGVLKEIQADGYFVEGFQAVFAGDIPKGAGLSSSAALESVFAKALNRALRIGH